MKKKHISKKPNKNRKENGLTSPESMSTFPLKMTGNTKQDDEASFQENNPTEAQAKTLDSKIQASNPQVTIKGLPFGLNNLAKHLTPNLEKKLQMAYGNLEKIDQHITDLLKNNPGFIQTEESFCNDIYESPLHKSLLKNPHYIMNLERHGNHIWKIIADSLSQKRDNVFSVYAHNMLIRNLNRQLERADLNIITLSEENRRLILSAHYQCYINLCFVYADGPDADGPDFSRARQHYEKAMQYKKRTMKLERDTKRLQTMKLQCIQHEFYYACKLPNNAESTEHFKNVRKNLKKIPFSEIPQNHLESLQEMQITADTIIQSRDQYAKSLEAQNQLVIEQAKVQVQAQAQAQTQTEPQPPAPQPAQIQAQKALEEKLAKEKELELNKLKEPEKKQLEEKLAKELEDKKQQEEKKLMENATIQLKQIIQRSIEQRELRQKQLIEQLDKERELSFKKHQAQAKKLLEEKLAKECLAKNTNDYTKQSSLSSKPF